MADDAVQRRFGRHGNHGFDCAIVDFLPGDDAVVEAGHYVTGAGGGFGLALDLQLVAARGDIDAEPVLDRDQILVILAEQRTQKMRLLERHFQARALGNVGAGMVRFLAHSKASLARHASRKDRQAPWVGEMASRLCGNDEALVQAAFLLLISPARLFGPALMISTSTMSPMPYSGAVTWTDCSQGVLPISWPG